MIFDCNIVRTSTIQAVNIKTSSIYYVVTNTTTAESTPITSPSMETEPTTTVETTTTTSTTTYKPEQGIVRHFHIMT